MYYTVKTLLSKGISQRKIAKDLGISRNTVDKIEKMIASGQSWPPPQIRQKKLSDFHDQIREFVENNKSAVLIHDYFTRIQGFDVSYQTIVRYVRQFKKSEVFVPMLCDPGEEAQVDFGVGLHVCLSHNLFYTSFRKESGRAIGLQVPI